MAIEIPVNFAPTPKRIERKGVIFEVLEVAYDHPAREFVALVRLVGGDGKFETISLSGCKEAS